MAQHYIFYFRYVSAPKGLLLTKVFYTTMAPLSTTMMHAFLSLFGCRVSEVDHGVNTVNISPFAFSCSINAQVFNFQSRCLSGEKPGR